MQSNGKRIYSTKKSVIGRLYRYYTDIANTEPRAPAIQGHLQK